MAPSPVRFAPRPIMRPQGDVAQLVDMARQLVTMHRAFLDRSASIVDEVKQLKQGPPGRPGMPGNDGRSIGRDEVRAILAELAPRPVRGKPGKSADARAVARMVYEMIGPIKPQQTISMTDVVEYLRENKLSLKDIDGLDRELASIRNITATGGMRGGGDTVVAGTGVTITNTHNGNKQISVTGTGFTQLTATGTVDGSNTAFTFTQKPTYIISDGAWYVQNNGWTWNAGTLTATMSVPPQTGIFGFV